MISPGLGGFNSSELARAWGGGSWTPLHTLSEFLWLRNLTSPYHKKETVLFTIGRYYVSIDSLTRTQWAIRVPVHSASVGDIVPNSPKIRLLLDNPTYVLADGVFHRVILQNVCQRTF